VVSLFWTSPNHSVYLRQLPWPICHITRKVKMDRPTGFQKPAMDRAREVRKRPRQTSNEVFAWRNKKMATRYSQSVRRR